MISKQDQAEVIKRIKREELSRASKNSSISEPNRFERAIGEFILAGLRATASRPFANRVGPERLQRRRHRRSAGNGVSLTINGTWTQAIPVPRKIACFAVPRR
jgi:hypothetical protein